MKRMLILGAAIVFICLMISACEGTVEEERITNNYIQCTKDSNI